MAVITISRQFGAGGLTLAEKVAFRLNYRFAHEEVIEKLMEKARIVHEHVHDFESEDMLGSVQLRQNFKQRFIDRIFDPGRTSMEDTTYIQLLRTIIPEIADPGNVVFLGRGAQFILKNRPDTHHVLLVADQDFRIRFMQEHYNLSLEKAKASLEKQDQRRDRLMRHFIRNSDYDHPLHYEVILNMSQIPIEVAVQAVCDLAAV
jgi:cytidylate kinase